MRLAVSLCSFSCLRSRGIELDRVLNEFVSIDRVSRMNHRSRDDRQVSVFVDRVLNEFGSFLRSRGIAKILYFDWSITRFKRQIFYALLYQFSTP